MKKTSSFFLLIGLFLSAFAAQTETLQLRLTRNWGYGGGSRIQGRFTLEASGPENLQEVTFYIDEEVIHTAAQPPFQIQFQTDDFSPGTHTLYALGVTSGGAQIRSNEYVREFLSPDEVRSDMKMIVLPILIVVGAITLITVAGPLLLGRNRQHRPGEYGIAGGAVCPRCGLPFSRGFLSPNLVVGKLERCPHCGKWSLRPRASSAELEAAEARLASEGTSETSSPEQEEEQLRKMLDDSRYDDSDL